MLLLKMTHANKQTLSVCMHSRSSTQASRRGGKNTILNKTLLARKTKAGVCSGEVVGNPRNPAIYSFLYICDLGPELRNEGAVDTHYRANTTTCMGWAAGFCYEQFSNIYISIFFSRPRTIICGGDGTRLTCAF